MQDLTNACITVGAGTCVQAWDFLVTAGSYLIREQLYQLALEHMSRDSPTRLQLQAATTVCRHSSPRQHTIHVKKTKRNEDEAELTASACTGYCSDSLVPEQMICYSDSLVPKRHKKQ
jgi:hypothetical protein